MRYAGVFVVQRMTIRVEKPELSTREKIEKNFFLEPGNLEVQNDLDIKKEG